MNSHREPFIVIVGPDGAGKSTVTSIITTAIAAPTHTANFRERIVDRLVRRKPTKQACIADPHETTQLNVFCAAAKTCYLFADILLSRLYWYRLQRSGTAVIVERYAFDLDIDPNRLGISSSPRTLRRTLARVAPQPDYIILCKADSHQISVRKPELRQAEIEAQYSRWNSVRPRTKPRMYEIPTTDTQQAIAGIHAILTNIGVPRT